MPPKKSLSQTTQSLIDQWKQLYGKTLPDLAREHDPSQNHWPVHVDHCFGRIIMDNVIGQGKVPWMEKLKAPAVHHMSDNQLQGCIDLGQKIADGDVNLDELNEISLEVRGKQGRGTKRKRETSHVVKSETKLEAKDEDDESSSTTRKVKKEVDDDSIDHGEETNKDSHDQDEADTKSNERIHNGESADDSDTNTTTKRTTRQTGLKCKFFSQPEPKSRQEQSAASPPPHSSPSPKSKSSKSPQAAKSNSEPPKPTSKPTYPTTRTALKSTIQTSKLVPLRKKVLLALLAIPRGQYSTYGALSTFLSSSPRTIGQALRNNPYAPDVPCHRILAAGGKIGGFGGEWEGRHGVAEGEGPKTKEKRKLLREEGVRFDGKGIAVGRPWSAWDEKDVELEIGG